MRLIASTIVCACLVGTAQAEAIDVSVIDHEATAELINRNYPAYQGDVEPLENPGNEPFETCDNPDYRAFYEAIPWKSSVPGNSRATTLNLFYLYAAHRNVLETGDCSCDGKVVPLDAAQKIYDDLLPGVADPEPWMKTQMRRNKETMAAQVNKLCGGPF